MREAELRVDVRDCRQLDQRHGQGAVDREVGPADHVGEPSDEGGERPDRVGHHDHVQEVLERHVVRGQQQREDRPLHVVEVIEHDRGDNHDRQVPVARRRPRVVRKLAPHERLHKPVRMRCGG